MTNHELDFDAHQFLVLSRSKQARISRVLAARARNIVNLGPPAHALSFVRIALAWDQLADSMEEHSGQRVDRACSIKSGSFLAVPHTPNGPRFVDGKDHRGEA
jgi:hypothetical protein